MAKEKDEWDYEDPPNAPESPTYGAEEGGQWSYDSNPVKPPVARDTATGWGNFRRSALQGLTFGAGDEIEAYTMPRNPGESYDQALERIRGSYQAWGKENPWSDFAGQMVGGVPSALIPGLGASNVARLAGQGMSRGLLAAGASSGAKVGALQGFGSGEGDVYERGSNAIGGAAIGAGAGALGTAGIELATPVVNRARSAVEGVVRAGRTPVDRGVRETATAIADDGATIQGIRQSVLPTHRNVTPEQSEQIMVRYGELIAGGATERQARAAVGQEVAANGTFGPVTAATARSRSGAIIDRYAEQNRIPMQVHELPGFQSPRASGNPADNYNTNTLMQEAAGEASPNAASFRNNLIERNEELGSQINDAVGIAMGHGDPVTAIRNANVAMRAEHNSLYDGARAAAQPFDLSGTFANWRNDISQMGPSSKTGQKLREALELFGDEVRAPQSGSLKQATANTTRAVRGDDGSVIARIQREVPLLRERGDGSMFRPTQRQGRGATMDDYQPISDLDRFLDRKGDLDDMISASFENMRPTHLTARLTQLKNDIMGVVGETNPEWRAANATARANFTEADAIRMAGDLTLKTGPRAREILGQFDELSPSGQQLVRLQLSQHVRDKLQNAGSTDNLGKFFKSPASRDILRHVLNDDRAADALMSHIRRATRSAQSLRSLGGSQTQPRMRAAERRNALERITSLLSNLSPSNALKNLGEFAQIQNLTQRNDTALRLLSQSTDNPQQFFQVLRELEEATRIQNSSRIPPLPPGASRALDGAISATPGAAGGFAANVREEDEY